LGDVSVWVGLLWGVGDGGVVCVGVGGGEGGGVKEHESPL